MLALTKRRTEDNELLVADIAFAYDNGDLVKLLIKRGDAIKAGNQIKLIALNAEI